MTRSVRCCLFLEGLGTTGLIATGYHTRSRRGSGLRNPLQVNKMPMLVETFVSRASARQRRGRAGRVRPGTAFHLFSSRTSALLPEYSLPEMKRTALDDLVLQVPRLVSLLFYVSTWLLRSSMVPCPSMVCV